MSRTPIINTYRITHDWLVKTPSVNPKNNIRASGTFCSPLVILMFIYVNTDIHAYNYIHIYKYIQTVYIYMHCIYTHWSNHLNFSPRVDHFKDPSKGTCNFSISLQGCLMQWSRSWRWGVSSDHFSLVGNTQSDYLLDWIMMILILKKLTYTPISPNKRESRALVLDQRMWYWSTS